MAHRVARMERVLDVAQGAHPPGPLGARTQQRQHAGVQLPVSLTRFGRHLRFWRGVTEAHGQPHTAGECFPAASSTATPTTASTSAVST